MQRSVRTRLVRGAAALISGVVVVVPVAPPAGAVAAPAGAVSAAPAATAPAPTAPTASAPGATDPSSADSLALRDDREQLGPGITLQHRTSLDRGGWFDDQVVTVDLGRPAVSTELLTAGPGVSDRGPISAAADARGAVVATNGDFFDIDGTGAPLGAAVQGGTLLKSAQIGGRVQAGVGRDGIGRLVDAAVEARATFGGSDHTVLALNTPNGTCPADALIAFTPAWGAADRSRGLTGATGVVEATVVDGAVTDVTPGAGSGTIPAGGFVLQGRGAEATALAALRPSDPVALTYRLRDEVASRMQFVVGASDVLVRDGVAVPQTDTSVAPRTALGIKDGGRTLVLFTTDGRQTLVPGRTLAAVADRLVALGVRDAVNLDGGGSTTLVARAPGDTATAVRNRPSDGAERNDPNGIGVFVTPSGRSRSLVVAPLADPAAGRAGAVHPSSVFPGLHRTLTAAAVDDTLSPASMPSSVRWLAGFATVSGSGPRAVVAVPRGTTRRSISVSAVGGAIRGGTTLRVLGPLDRIRTGLPRLALTGTDSTAAVHVDVTGLDAQGYTAPVELQDLRLQYDRGVIAVTADGSGLRIRPVAGGATLLTMTAPGGVTTTLPVTVGVRTSTVYTFDHADETSRWTPNGTVPAEQRLSMQDGRLRLDHSARRNQGITFTGSPEILQLPGAPLRVRMVFTSSGPMQFSSLRWTDAAGVNGGFLGPPIVAGQQAIDWTFPAGTAFPVRLTYFQTVETDALKQKPGWVVFDRIEIDSAPELELPPVPAPRPDPLVSVDGSAPTGGRTWTYATLSDVQFTAADPELAKVGVAALKRIGQLHPDLVVLNGDITDLGSEADIALARSTLEQGGCDLVAVGQEPPPDSTPEESTGRFPCYYVPGNHESYRVGGQGDLAPFEAQFGRPYRTFDHKGTRFVLLDSALGTLRDSDFDQLPMLQQALAGAAADPSVRNVLVFAHHPVDDPAEAGTSRLGDRMEVALVEKWLSDFRTRTGKGAAMTGSHAQIMDVRRIEGVPYTVLPSSGKAPYGTPDQGGFTGFLRWTVDPGATADQRWLTADVRPFAQSVTLQVPGEIGVGRSAAVSGSLVQPSGVRPGDRVVPLRYPMSVHWSGSATLAIGSGATAVQQARAAGKVAVLDPSTRTLTGLRAGTVTLRVTADSMREYTGAASLAPVVGSATVRVTG